MQPDVLLLSEMIEAAGQHKNSPAASPPASWTPTASAVMRCCGNFTVPGEAAGQLSDDINTRFPEVSWQQPVRPRNRIVHGYWSVDMEILHTAARHQLPGFQADLERVLATLGEST